MDRKESSVHLQVHTIGHSNHKLETLVDLLKQNEIEVAVDVRSSPYAQYAKHFNREPLQQALRADGAGYLFLGNLIGGRPDEDEFYDDEGYVLYDRLAGSPKFQEGIDRLLKGIRAYRVALLCSEEDPTECHRRRLIGRVLRDHGVDVLHVRGDGRVQKEDEVAKEEELEKTGGQLTLFGMQEPDEWKSTQSVSQRKAPRSSSKRSDRPESGA